MYNANMQKNQLQKQDILHLAKLANLQISDSEVEKYQKQLGETLQFVENLKELDASKTKEAHQVTDLTNIYFQDGEKNTRSLSSKEALANAKEVIDDYFAADKVL